MSPPSASCVTISVPLAAISSSVSDSNVVYIEGAESTDKISVIVRPCCGSSAQRKPAISAATNFMGIMTVAPFSVVTGSSHQTLTARREANALLRAITNAALFAGVSGRVTVIPVLVALRLGSALVSTSYSLITSRIVKLRPRLCITIVEPSSAATNFQAARKSSPSVNIEEAKSPRR